MHPSPAPQRPLLPRATPHTFHRLAKARDDGGSRQRAQRRRRSGHPSGHPGGHPGGHLPHYLLLTRPHAPGVSPRQLVPGPRHLPLPRHVLNPRERHQPFARALRRGEERGGGDGRVHRLRRLRQRREQHHRVPLLHAVEEKQPHRLGYLVLALALTLVLARSVVAAEPLRDVSHALLGVRAVQEPRQVLGIVGNHLRPAEPLRLRETHHPFLRQRSIRQIAQSRLPPRARSRRYTTAPHAHQLDGECRVELLVLPRQTQH